MTERIAVGDLVQVVKACCSKNVRAPIFTVAEISGLWSGTKCEFCKTTSPNDPVASDRGGGKWFVYPISWLKRIPPLEELEGVKTDEPIKEPA